MGLGFCGSGCADFSADVGLGFCAVLRFCFGSGMRELEGDGVWGPVLGHDRLGRENESPGTTSEERLCAGARVRCRYSTSEPAISCVVTRDGLKLRTTGRDCQLASDIMSSDISE